MMQINSISFFRVLTLGLISVLYSSFLFGQQMGAVEKSSETMQVGNQVYFLHTIAKGNTLYSLSKAYEVSVNEIKAINPGLNNELKLGAVILIPKALEVAPQIAATNISYDNYFYHVVKQGESMFAISRIYGVKVDDLVKLNELSSTNISPGFYLKIPEIEIKTVEPPKESEPQQVINKESRYFEHIVKSKETLFSIAKRYGIGLETLKYINNFSNNSIRIGQIVLIPKVLQDWQNQESKNYIMHQVQPKEGLYGIARKYGVTIAQIQALNQGLNTNISIGQDIKIPRKPNVKGYIEHKVSENKEKLTNIAREYEVSISNLRDMNPDAPSKVRKGEIVFIPVDFIDDKKEELLVTDKLEEVGKEEIQPEHKIYIPNTNHVFNVAFMLPLYLKEVDSLLNIEPNKLLANRNKLKAFQFLEFYEGAQIAVDSLRKLGMQLNFHVYDVSDNEIETALLLQNRSLAKMDLIISLLFSRNFALVSNFSQKHRIPLVNALSKRREIVYNNPYVFKISPKPEALYNRVADFVGENLSNFNTIIVRNNPYQLANEYNLISGLLQEKINHKAPISNNLALQKIDTYMEGKAPKFIETLNHELVKSDFSFQLKDLIDSPFDTTWVNNPVKTVVYSNDSIKGILQHASLFRDNLIIALGSDEVFAIELFTKLNFVRDSFNIKVIGLPDWHSYMNLDVDYSQPFNLRVASENFVDYNTPDVIRFVKKFHAAYNKVPEIETYSFLGYDATFYFLQALFYFGDDLLENISDFHIPLLQNQLHFERQNMGGYENTYWNIYRQENYQYKLEK